MSVTSTHDHLELLKSLIGVWVWFWTINLSETEILTKSLKRANRDYFLKKLVFLQVDKTMLKMFYSAFVESAQTFCIVCWYGALTESQELPQKISYSCKQNPRHSSEQPTWYPFTSGPGQSWKNTFRLKTSLVQRVWAAALRSKILVPSPHQKQVQAGICITGDFTIK